MRWVRDPFAVICALIAGGALTLYVC